MVLSNFLNKFERDFYDCTQDLTRRPNLVLFIIEKSVSKFGFRFDQYLQMFRDALFWTVTDRLVKTRPENYTSFFFCDKFIGIFINIL